MSTVPGITDLDKVIQPYLNGAELLSFSSRYLTQPGDNYGSLMLSLSCNIRTPDGKEEVLPLVAKLPPLTNDMFWAVFKPEITAIRENCIYTDVSPSVRQLQLDAGIPEDELIDIFAKCYGCRISLDENATKLDRDAVLVLENLQNSGYKAGKRQVMFDLEHIKVVLKYIAKYHALPIALRKLQPIKFEKIRQKFYRFSLTDDMGPEMEKQFQDQTNLEYELAVGDDVKVLDRCKALDAYFKEYMTNPAECEHGLFTTLSHNDLWINNVMVYYDETGAPKKLKIVDFQIAQYESLAHDIIFLLFSSVDTDVLENHYYDLLKYYYEEFIDCLASTKCDIDEYSFHKFMMEIHRIAPVQIPHSMFMSRVLLADDKSMPEDYKDLNMEVIKVISPVLLNKLKDIVRLSQKFGLFW